MSDEKDDQKVISITSLGTSFKNRAEMQQYAQQLFLKLKAMTENVQKLELENKHLKELLTNAVPMIKGTEPPKFEVSVEQEIAEIQLKYLKEISLERQLTLDETKKFDLLLKNLYLATGKPTTVLKGKFKRLKDAEEMDEAELISLAKEDKKDS